MVAKPQHMAMYSIFSFRLIEAPGALNRYCEAVSSQHEPSCRMQSVEPTKDLTMQSKFPRDHRKNGRRYLHGSRQRTTLKDYSPRMTRPIWLYALPATSSLPWPAVIPELAFCNTA